MQPKDQSSHPRLLRSLPWAATERPLVSRKKKRDSKKKRHARDPFYTHIDTHIQRLIEERAAAEAERLRLEAERLAKEKDAVIQRLMQQLEQESNDRKRADELTLKRQEEDERRLRDERARQQQQLENEQRAKLEAQQVVLGLKSKVEEVENEKRQLETERANDERRRREAEEENQRQYHMRQQDEIRRQKEAQLEAEQWLQRIQEVGIAQLIISLTSFH